MLYRSSYISRLYIATLDNLYLKLQKNRLRSHTRYLHYHFYTYITFKIISSSIVTSHLLYYHQIDEIDNNLYYLDYRQQHRSKQSLYCCFRWAIFEILKMSTECYIYLIISHHSYYFCIYIIFIFISSSLNIFYNIIKSMRYMIIYVIYIIDSNIEISKLYINASNNLHLKIQKNWVKLYVTLFYLYILSFIYIILYLLYASFIICLRKFK